VRDSKEAVTSGKGIGLHPSNDSRGSLLDRRFSTIGSHPDRTIRRLGQDYKLGGGSTGTPGDESEIIDDTAQSRQGQRNVGQFKQAPQGMVVHHTSGGQNAQDTINTFKQRGYPAQFIVDRDGKIHRYLPEGASGAHTKPGGTGTIGARGRGLGNQNMEGVEVIAKNDKDVTPGQRDAVARLAGMRARRFGWDPKQGVYGHGELNYDKERDEGMSSVSRIRSGELSTDAPGMSQVAGPGAGSPGDPGDSGAALARNRWRRGERPASGPEPVVGDDHDETPRLPRGDPGGLEYGGKSFSERSAAKHRATMARLRRQGKPDEELEQASGKGERSRDSFADRFDGEAHHKSLMQLHQMKKELSKPIDIKVKGPSEGERRWHTRRSTRYNQEDGQRQTRNNATSDIGFA
jgi:hypothetical protein